jgi:hypothetical protein
MVEHQPQPPMTEEQELRARAEQRVSDRSHLLQHIGSYIIINGFLVVVWALTGHGYPWFLWVMAGWGIGLAAHIVGYFTGTRGQAVRDKMVEREMERLRTK